MITGFSETDWIIRLGRITRTNHAGGREQAEEGALRQVTDDANTAMEKARELVPFFIKGVTCPSGCAGPEVKDEVPVPKVLSYQLSDGKWFSIASAENFGFKVVCK